MTDKERAIQYLEDLLVAHKTYYNGTEAIIEEVRSTHSKDESYSHIKFSMIVGRTGSQTVRNLIIEIPYDIHNHVRDVFKKVDLL